MKYALIYEPGASVQYADHKFILALDAVNASTFASKAYAYPLPNDTYFNGQHLENWDIEYKFDYNEDLKTLKVGQEKFFETTMNEIASHYMVKPTLTASDKFFKPSLCFDSTLPTSANIVPLNDVTIYMKNESDFVKQDT